MLKPISRLLSYLRSDNRKTPDRAPTDHARYSGYHLIFPESANALLALGEHYLQDGDLTTAERIFDDALARGGNPGVVANIHALKAYDRGEYPIALEKARIAIEHQCGTFLTHMIAGASAYRMGKRQDALALFEDGRRITAAPQLTQILSGVASAALELGDTEKARNSIDEALRHDPRNESALLSAMLVFDLLGEEERLNQCIATLQRWHPDSDAARMNMGTIALSRGNYEEGWRLREARLRLGEFKNHYIRPSLHQREKWDGHPYVGKRLLVFCEQGLGDTVMLARFLPAVKRLGGTLIVECQPEAIALLEPSIDADEWIAIKYLEEPETPYDLWVPSMSLPFLLDIEPNNCIPAMPYLQVPPDILAYWHNAVPTSPKLRIGIAWSGNPTLRMDSIRSMQYADLASLVECKDIEFHILQLNHDAPTPLPENLIDHSGELLTLADTAALASNMHLIITIDSVLVHVAGALGLPTWLLLPDHYEWRWTRSGQATPWYPSVRVIRQRRLGCWSEVIQEVRNELATRKHALERNEQ